MATRAERTAYVLGGVDDAERLERELGARGEIFDSMQVNGHWLVMVRAPENQTKNVRELLQPNPQVAYTEDEARDLWKAAAVASPREAPGRQTQNPQTSGER